MVLPKSMVLFFTIFIGITVSSSYYPKRSEYKSYDSYIFEDRIVTLLDKIKNFLKKGDPQNGINRLDPHFIPYKTFDFILNDTTLNGSFENLKIQNFSDYEILVAEFKLLPPRVIIKLLFPKIFIDGTYKINGNLLGSLPLNGSGKFNSETTDAIVTISMKPYIAFLKMQIKDLNLEYKVLQQKVKYTNLLEDQQIKTLNEPLVLYILHEIQVKYFPSILHTFQLLVNHFLIRFTLREIFIIIARALIWGR